MNTRDKLIAAAAEEFDAHGFSGTDSNKIARRAGFAPQTFYRSFKDKTAIFLAVFEAWAPEERNLIAWLVSADADETTLLDTAIGHHRRYLAFRRSLGRLVQDDPEVRRARAESRAGHIAQVRVWARRSAKLSDGWIGTALITLERLSEAIAAGELADMGADEAAARTVMGRILEGLRSGEL